MGGDIPSIPPNSKFCSKSFTIDGLAIVDTADIDLRGVKVVDLSDNTRAFYEILGGSRYHVFNFISKCPDIFESMTEPDMADELDQYVEHFV